jgi:octaprenyl-diphosphate synthase
MTVLKDKIMAAVKNDLAAIEEALRDNLDPHLDLVAEVAGHILFNGGKRLRPLLMVLSARLCGYNGDYDKTFSTIFEYLHAATLLHDDLVDDASVRRGKPVANSLWGNSTAVLVGDFLLARGLAIAAAAQSPAIIQVIADITANMSQGEIHQLSRKGALDLTESEYLDIIRCKTAVLFQGACRISAILANADQVKEAALSDFGFHIGMAFQMADDLLDYTFDSRILGKSVGADLREGKLTLPVIYALQQADSGDRKRMKALIQDEDFSEDDFQWLVAVLKKYGGIGYTENLAAAHVVKAKQSLSLFEDSGTKHILLDIADYALERKY